MQQIIAMGGGGFLIDGDNRALDRYILAQARAERPKVCFLGQAGGESIEHTLRFYRAFRTFYCAPSDLSLFRPHTADIEAFLLEQDVIYVGGGNTKSMLALWREWGLDHMLRKTAANGTVLAGVSAGAICWFEYGSTDSIPGKLSALPTLGYLSGSCSPHYDGEVQRRPRMHEMVAAAAAHFIDGKLVSVVSLRPNAKGYFIERVGDEAQETVLETHYLLKD